MFEAHACCEVEEEGWWGVEEGRVLKGWGTGCEGVVQMQPTLTPGAFPVMNPGLKVLLQDLEL